VTNNAAPKMNIPYSSYQIFYRKWNNGNYSGQRFGQAFFNHFECQKMTPNGWLNALYNAPSHQAETMILNIMDWDN